MWIKKEQCELQIKFKKYSDKCDKFSTFDECVFCKKRCLYIPKNAILDVKSILVKNFVKNVIIYSQNIFHQVKILIKQYKKS